MIVIVRGENHPGEIASGVGEIETPRDGDGSPSIVHHGGCRRILEGRDRRGMAAATSVPTATAADEERRKEKNRQFFQRGASIVRSWGRLEWSMVKEQKLGSIIIEMDCYRQMIIPMKKNLARKYFLPLLIVSISWMLPERALAQENAYRNGFVLGGWAGYGQVNVDSANISSSSNGTFALGFTGGYAITSRFVLGVEVNGWTLESYNLHDPSKGESISNISIGINYFPFVLPVFIDVGVGQVSYTSNNPNVSGRDKGVSWFLGSGFELLMTKKFVFVPQLRYSQGNLPGVDISVVEVTLGIKWYSGKDE